MAKKIGGDAMAIKILTVRIPEKLWKKLKFMQIDGKIKSINQAVVDALSELAKKLS